MASLFFNPNIGIDVIVAQNKISREERIRTKLKYIVRITKAQTITTCVVFSVKSISAINPGFVSEWTKKVLAAVFIVPKLTLHMFAEKMALMR